MTREIPPKLQAVMDELGALEGQEKLELLLEFADNLPSLPEHLHAQRNQMEQIHECASPVYVLAERDGPAIVYHFDVPEEAPTVRGYVGMLREGLEGATPEHVLALPADFYFATGIQKVLSPQRLNGITAVLGYLKRQALRVQEQAA